MCAVEGLGLFLVGLAIATVEGFPESPVLNVSPVLHKGGGDATKMGSVRALSTGQCSCRKSTVC